MRRKRRQTTPDHAHAWGHDFGEVGDGATGLLIRLLLLQKRICLH
jgi:hypothetical protein